MTELAPTTITIPTLETANLFLRAPGIQDFEHEAEFFAGDRSQFVGGPLSRSEAWRALASVIGHWGMRGFGFWALEEKTTGQYMGRVGLWEPDGWPAREIGWTVMDAAEGKGYAHEAAVAARAYAYGPLCWTTAISLIGVTNTRSAALATRLGATLEKGFRHPRFGEMNIWRHPGPAEVRP